jgi:hypothetical protein
VSISILVSGMLAGVPRQGGATWSVLQYVLGLQRLGHQVTFVEPAAGAGAPGSPASCYFADVCREFGLDGSAALIDPGTGQCTGLSRAELLGSAASADLLLNLSGCLADEEILDSIAVRAFVDIDPVFTQLWHAVDGIDMGFSRHNRFVTIGQAIGTPGCSVPTCGRTWIATPQPVVLEHWPVGNGVTRDALTTVGHWRSYGAIEHEGIHFGQKAHSLRELIDLPTRCDERFELALGIHPGEEADLDALRVNGWELVDPDAVAGTPERYREFVTGSWAELGIAKSGYVAGASGWFSDRSVCYLASGRPVIAQDTGFAPFVPTGTGLLSFATGEEALDAVAAVRGDYERHRQGARALAEDVFDSDRVLTRLIECL